LSARLSVGGSQSRLEALILVPVAGDVRATSSGWVYRSPVADPWTRR